MRRRFRQKYGLKVKGVMGLLRSDSLCVQPSLTTPCGETSTSVESKSVKIQGLDIQSSISQPSELTHVIFFWKKEFCLRGASVDSQSAPWEGLRWDISWLDINRQKNEENLQSKLRVTNPGGYFEINWSCFLVIPQLFQAFWFRLPLPCRSEQHSRLTEVEKYVNFAR